MTVCSRAAPLFNRAGRAPLSLFSLFYLAKHFKRRERLETYKAESCSRPKSHTTRNCSHAVMVTLGGCSCNVYNLVKNHVVSFPPINGSLILLFKQPERSMNQRQANWRQNVYVHAILVMRHIRRYNPAQSGQWQHPICYHISRISLH
jgi:hypothetical protein